MAYDRQELQAGFRVGDCLIQPSQNRIVRNDGNVHLEPRVMAVLVCLAEHAGEVVSRESLHQAVWGRIVVTDQALTNCVSELRQHLGDDRSSARLIETIPKRGYRLAAPLELTNVAPEPEEPARMDAHAPSGRRRWPAMVGLALLAALAIGLAWWWPVASVPTQTSVSVITFDNAADDPGLDYLSLALADEVATLLSRSPQLAVRPFDYLDGDDPLADARARQVSHVISGRYYREEKGRLALAVEAQNVNQERVVWRTRITSPTGNLLALRQGIADRVRLELLPALGAAAGHTSTSVPANDEAYQLYLRSLAMPKQPQPTRRAIAMLEQAVALDPGFAPAWAALGTRYYDDGTYGSGGLPARQRSLAANRRALQIDPGLVFAASQIIAHQAESGDLAAAYADARRLVDTNGGVEAHFALTYVYRFGGLLESAQRHCELAFARDPQNPRLRSCGYAYLYAGKLSQVMRFLQLDEGSYFTQWGTVLYLLRDGNDAAALKVTRQAASGPIRRLMEPCLEGRRGPALTQPAAEFERYWSRSGDPEARYAVAPMLSHCGFPSAALRLLERAVDGSFCAYPALDQDPVWAELRGDPEFQRIRGKAIACHEEFRRTVDAQPG